MRAQHVRRNYHNSKTEISPSQCCDEMAEDKLPRTMYDRPLAYMPLTTYQEQGSEVYQSLPEFTEALREKPEVYHEKPEVYQ